MKKTILTIIVLILSIQAQVPKLKQMERGLRDSGKYYAWVYFTDKGVENVGKIKISSKAITRRDKRKTIQNSGWYDQNLAQNYIDKITDTGVNLRHQSRWFNSISIECTEEQLATIAQFHFVKEIKPVNRFKREKILVEQSEKNMGKVGGLTDIDYGNALGQIQQINADKAHDAGYYGQGVTVLMLDTGFNLDHPVFDSLDIIAEWDVINNDSTTKNEAGQDSSEQHSHGTATFSALGGYASGYLVGPAFKASFLLAKTERLDEEVIAEEDDFVAGLQWGYENGAEVMSSSLGYTDWYTFADMNGNTAITTKAVDIAVGLGMVCVTAAGNENNNSWGHIIAPADADSVIAVGAVDFNGNIAYFSSRGPSYDDRLKPEMCAMGVSTAAASGDGTSYGYSSGTSLATPLVAGAAAQILSAYPDLTPMMVREALFKTASRAHIPDNDYGYGIINVFEAINYCEFISTKFELKQNYPNPFYSITTIKYDLKESTNVKLYIYNILGQKVTTLIDKQENAGIKRIAWDGTDHTGQMVSTGIYFFKLILDDADFTKKMLLIK